MSRFRVLRMTTAAVVALLLSGFLGGEAFAPALAAPPARVPDRLLPLPHPPAEYRGRTLPPDRLTPPPGPAATTVPSSARCPQWWGLARELGWDDESLLRLDVVMFRESRCLPDVWNRDDPNGGSRGLLQVNGSWTRWLRELDVLAEKEDLFDPKVNLAAALAIYRYGLDRYEFGWGPWGYRYKDPYQG
jgi:hypothetical protein